MFFALLASASSLLVKEPVDQKMTDFQTLDLGTVGPGQKLEVISERPGGEPSKNVAQGNSEALWDVLKVEQTPEAWKGEASKLYESPMKAFVTLPENAPEGQQAFMLKAIDEYDGLQPLVVKATVKVSYDMLDAQVENPKLTAGVNQPAVYYIKLKNKSSASDVFEITAKGLPSQWKYSKRVFVRHNSEETVPYEVVGTEQGDYSVELSVKSLSSNLIAAKQNVQLSTRSSISLDMQAASHGVLLFPTVEQTVYSLLALLSFVVR